MEMGNVCDYYVWCAFSMIQKMNFEYSQKKARSPQRPTKNSQVGLCYILNYCHMEMMNEVFLDSFLMQSLLSIYLCQCMEECSLCLAKWYCQSNLDHTPHIVLWCGRKHGTT